MRGKIWDVDEDTFRNYVKDSFNYSEIVRKCGLTANNHTTLKKRIAKLNIDISHFNTNPGAFKKNDTNNPRLLRKKSLEEICVKDSTYSTGHLKKRLYNELHWDKKCSECNLETWQGKEITLELDHINGNNEDHRLENLRILCPNCHSQTDTYKGRNYKCPRKVQKKCKDCNINIFKTSTRCKSCSAKYNFQKKGKKIPTYEQLQQDLKELKYNTVVGKKYGVSDNCVRKWIQRYEKYTP